MAVVSVSADVCMGRSPARKNRFMLLMPNSVKNAGSAEASASLMRFESSEKTRY